MALNIGSTGQTFDPYVKYNGKAGRWYIKAEDGENEIPHPTFVADFENIKTGWFKFVAGMAPDKVFDKSLSEAAAKPSEEHKRGFEIRLFSAKAFGGVVVLSGSSMHLNNSIAALYAEYEEGVKSNAGKLPVVKCTGVTPMKDKQGTNYKPEFTIEKWVPRPAELVSTSVATQATTGQATQTQPASKPVVASNTESEF